MLIAETISYLIGIYAIVGIIFALIFVPTGLKRVDPATKNASFGFKLLVVPGLAAFWPLFLFRWLRGTDGPPIERNSHRVKTANRNQEPIK